MKHFGASSGGWGLELVGGLSTLSIFIPSYPSMVASFPSSVSSSVSSLSVAVPAYRVRLSGGLYSAIGVLSVSTLTEPYPTQEKNISKKLYTIYMNFTSHLENIKKLKLPKRQFVIVSSGSLAVRGIREAKDVDMIVTPKLWDALSKKYPVINKGGFDRLDVGNDIEVLGPGSSFANSSVVPIEVIFTQADIFDEMKFINLNHLKKIKEKLGREKDLEDIKLIDEYLRK
jgi:hypothetical protein